MSYVQPLTWFGLPSAVASNILGLGCARCSDVLQCLAESFKIAKGYMRVDLHNKKTNT